MGKCGLLIKNARSCYSNDKQNSGVVPELLGFFENHAAGEAGEDG